MNQKTFNQFNLSEDIRLALSDLQYNEPTEVQQKVIPKILEGKDVVVQSQTGSGKTASFGIPLCELVEWRENKPQALILTPTRELAAQITDDIIHIGRYKRVNATAIFGKASYEKQKQALKQKTHMVVGTPGRVLDHIDKGTLPLEQIQYLVIDEADEMLNMGFIDQVEAIIQALPTERITLLFSATFPEDMLHLSDQYMKQPETVTIKETGFIAPSTEHYYVQVEEEEKLNVLESITVVENPASCMIFCNTQISVDRLDKALHENGYPCEKIHGGLVQTERFAVMNDFKKGKFSYLIATDVAARGIDVDSVSLVVNYDFPMEKESYVHRTGRTGRAGKRGKSISLVTPKEDRFFEDVETYIGNTIKQMERPTEETVMRGEADFWDTIQKKPKLKEDKKEKLNKDIMKLYFNGGKKKKIRAVDFVGTIANIQGVEAGDIGIITIEDNVSFVEILHGKGPHVLKTMKTTTIKGKQLKVYEAFE